MSWVFLTLLAALFLGIYDLAKKASVRDNAVAPVLLISCLCQAMLWIPFVIWSATHPAFSRFDLFYVDSLPVSSHAYLISKSLLVGASWTCAYFALKHLPLTIATPIRATSPLWTVLIAVVFLAERPTRIQWIGMVTILISFLTFSLVGKQDGIQFSRDRSIGLMLLATALATISAIYDKYLMQNLEFRVATVQAWFSIYLIPVMIPLAVYWYFRQRNSIPLDWRWTIPLIGVTLVAADYFYFSALRIDGALISLVAPLRRTSVVIAFLGARHFFGEKNLRAKAICTATMMAGVWLLTQ